MNKGRLEAFSDAVIAVIITLMVLQLKPPAGASFSSLTVLDPIFLVYILSFIFLGVFWHNHNLLFQAVSSVNSLVLLANLNFLFWLSLVPFCLSWIGTDGFSSSNVLFYGIIIFFSSISFLILVIILKRVHGDRWTLLKGMPHKRWILMALLFYLIGIILSFSFPKIAFFIYSFGILIRIVPALRVEKNLSK